MAANRRGYFGLTVALELNDFPEVTARLTARPTGSPNAKTNKNDMLCLTVAGLNDLLCFQYNKHTEVPGMCTLVRKQAENMSKNVRKWEILRQVSQQNPTGILPYAQRVNIHDLHGQSYAHRHIQDIKLDKQGPL